MRDHMANLARVINRLPAKAIFTVLVVSSGSSSIVCSEATQKLSSYPTSLQKRGLPTHQLLTCGFCATLAASHGPLGQTSAGGFTVVGAEHTTTAVMRLFVHWQANLLPSTHLPLAPGGGSAAHVVVWNPLPSCETRPAVFNNCWKRVALWEAVRHCRSLRSFALLSLLLLSLEAAVSALAQRSAAVAVAATCGRALHRAAVAAAAAPCCGVRVT